MPDFITFGRQASKDIIDTVRTVRGMPKGGGDRYPVGQLPFVQIRVAKTTTNSDYPTYPTSGDTFVVALGEMSFPDGVGSQTQTWEAYDPVDTRLAHDLAGTYYTENSYVLVGLHHGRWWILRGGAVFQAARIISSGTANDWNCTQAETGSVTYTATPGRRAMTFTADSPQALITVYEMNGPPPEAGDIVFTATIGGRVYIIRTTGKSRLKATVTQTGGIAANSSGEVRIYQNGLATSRYEIAYANWMVTSTISQNKKVIVEWFDDEAKWIIVSAEC